MNLLVNNATHRWRHEFETPAVRIWELFQLSGRFFGWSLFSRPVKGTYVCVSGYIIFSEELPRTRFYPPSALSISWDGFGNGMKTFLPEFLTSLRDSGHFSRYLKSVLHSPQQRCLVLTILRRIRGQTSHFKRFSRISEHPYISFIDMHCLSEPRGGSDLM